MSMRNRYGLNADRWCNPTSTLNMLLSSPATRAPWFDTLSTMSCISFWYVALPRASPDLLLRYPTRYRLLHDVGLGRICCASSWHESKLAFLNFRAFLQWAVANTEFLITSSVVGLYGNGFRYVLPFSISLQGRRCMDILTAMADVKHSITNYTQLMNISSTWTT